MGCAGGAPHAKQPIGHFEKQTLQAPEDAPDGAKTVRVSYVFDRDLVNKEFKKTFRDNFEKKGIKVDEQLDARAHFEVSGAKITGTVTYVKKGLGRYSIIDADLVAEAHYDADVQLDLDVKVKGDTKRLNEKDLSETALGGKPYPLVKNMMPANIPIAGPLFLHAHFDLNAACEIGVEGQMHATAGVGIKGDVHLAARYKKAGFEATPAADGEAQGDGKKSKFKFEAKAPNFELSPKPYLTVQGKQQQIKGWCSLQPTAVLLVENMVGASIVVEPWLEIEAKRASSRQPFQLGAEVGVTVSAAPELRILGRKIGKKKEFELMELTLAKLGHSELGPGPKNSLPDAEPRRPSTPRTEIAAAPPPPPAPADAAPSASDPPAPSATAPIATNEDASKSAPSTPSTEPPAESSPAVADARTDTRSDAASDAPAAVADNTPPPALGPDGFQMPPPKPTKERTTKKGSSTALRGSKPVVRKPSPFAGAAKLLKKKR